MLTLMLVVLMLAVGERIEGMRLMWISKAGHIMKLYWFTAGHLEIKVGPKKVDCADIRQVSK